MRRAAVVSGVLVVLAGLVLLVSPWSRFVLGGAFVNAGYRLQDPIESFDLEHPHVTPAQAWAEVQRQNGLAAAVRERFPRTTRHPVVALLACMDARLDTVEVTGDTRRNYYVVRTAGSVMDAKEEEMLELAVANGVKLVVLTRHTDCAAEKAAKDPAAAAKFPSLVAAVQERQKRVEEFLARPFIAKKIADGELLVKELWIDTKTDALVDR